VRIAGNDRRHKAGNDRRHKIAQQDTILPEIAGIDLPKTALSRHFPARRRWYRAPDMKGRKFLSEESQKKREPVPPI
jgi:hypothetical protein